MTKLWGDRYFLRAYASITALSFAVIAALSILLATRSAGAALTQINAEMVNQMEGAGKSVESQINELIQLYNLLEVDKDIYIFLNQLESDSRVYVMSENRVRRYKQINQAVASVLLYNAATGEQILVGTRPLLSDEELSQLHDEPNGALMFGRFGMQKKNTHLLMLSVGDEANGQKQSRLVFFIDSAVLLESMVLSDENDVFAVDDTGRIVLHTDVTRINEMYNMPEAMTAAPGSGSLRVRDSVINYSRNSFLNLTFISTRSYNSVAGVVNREMAGIVVIGAFLLLTVAALGYIVSKRLYSPIRVISNTMEDYFMQTQSSGAGGNELYQIIEAFEGSLSQIKALQEKSLKDSEALKNSTLRALLISDGAQEPSDGAAESAEIYISFDNLFIAVLSIDRYAAIPSERRGTLETLLCAIVNEAVKETLICETVNLYGGEFALLMKFCNEERNSFTLLHQSLVQIRDELFSALKLSVTIALGGITNSKSECRKVFEQARSLIQQRFVLGCGQIITRKLLEERLLNALRAGRRKDFEELLDSLLGMISLCRYPDSLVRLLQLVLSVVGVIRQLPSSGKRERLDFAEFLRMEVLQDARRRLLELYDEYTEMALLLAQSTESKHRGIIDFAKNYIIENYSNTDLSVDTLADAMGYSNNYFSRIFKEYTGMYTLDYIRQVRINKAKELLKDEQMKVKAIAKQVGYTDENYFSSAFKKEVGLTPSSFRGLIRKDGR